MTWGWWNEGGVFEDTPICGKLVLGCYITIGLVVLTGIGGLVYLLI